MEQDSRFGGMVGFKVVNRVVLRLKANGLDKKGPMMAERTIARLRCRKMESWLLAVLSAALAFVLSGCAASGDNGSDSSEGTMLPENAAYTETELEMPHPQGLLTIYYEKEDGCLYGLSRHGGLKSSTLIWKSSDKGEAWEEAVVLPEELERFEPHSGMFDSEGNLLVALDYENAAAAAVERGGVFLVKPDGTFQQMKGFDGLGAPYVDAFLSDDKVLVSDGPTAPGEGPACYLYDVKAQKVVCELDFPDDCGYPVAYAQLDEKSFIVCGEKGNRCFDLETGEAVDTPEGLGAFLDGTGDEWGAHLMLQGGRLLAFSPQGISSFDLTTGEISDLGAISTAAIEEGKALVSDVALADDGAVYMLYFEMVGGGSLHLSRFDPVG